MNIAKYIDKYDSFSKKIVYVFNLGDGGIGDYTKFFLHILDLCIKYSIRLYVLKSDMILHKFLKLKYEKMYTVESSNIYPQDISTLQSDILYAVTPFMFYNQDLNLNLPLSSTFYFTDDILKNIPSGLEVKGNISIHLRLGDSFLETDPNYVLCKTDTRKYNESDLFKFIENNTDKNIIFFCDNITYKLKVKSKYDFIKITPYQIGHTSLSNTTEQEVLDGITEFYLLSQSDAIYYASNSGFSLMASKFNDIPYKKI
jgi:hypothetical protein